MVQTPGKKPKTEERSQRPLWFAIVGLLISVASFGLGNMQIADVVLWGGGVFAVIALIYWFVQPTHGL